MLQTSSKHRHCSIHPHIYHPVCTPTTHVCTPQVITSLSIWLHLMKTLNCTNIQLNWFQFSICEHHFAHICSVKITNFVKIYLQSFLKYISGLNQMKCTNLHSAITFSPVSETKQLHTMICYTACNVDIIMNAFYDQLIWITTSYESQSTQINIAWWCKW